MAKMKTKVIVLTHRNIFAPVSETLDLECRDIPASRNSTETIRQFRYKGVWQSQFIRVGSLPAIYK